MYMNGRIIQQCFRNHKPGLYPRVTSGSPRIVLGSCIFNSSGDSNEHPCLRIPRLEKQLIGRRKWWRSKAQEKKVHFCSFKFSNFFWGLTAIQEPFDMLEGEYNTHFKCTDVESYSINIF